MECRDPHGQATLKSECIFATQTAGSSPARESLSDMSKPNRHSFITFPVWGLLLVPDPSLHFPCEWNSEWMNEMQPLDEYKQLWSSPFSIILKYCFLLIEKLCKESQIFSLEAYCQHKHEKYRLSIPIISISNSILLFCYLYTNYVSGLAIQLTAEASIFTKVVHSQGDFLLYYTSLVYSLENRAFRVTQAQTS
jgi:hypothetical protein